MYRQSVYFVVLDLVSKHGTTVPSSPTISLIRFDPSTLSAMNLIANCVRTTHSPDWSFASAVLIQFIPSKLTRSPDAVKF